MEAVIRNNRSGTRTPWVAPRHRIRRYCIQVPPSANNGCGHSHVRVHPAGLWRLSAHALLAVHATSLIPDDDITNTGLDDAENICFRFSKTLFHYTLDEIWLPFFRFCSKRRHSSSDLSYAYRCVQPCYTDSLESWERLRVMHDRDVSSGCLKQATLFKLPDFSHVFPDHLSPNSLTAKEARKTYWPMITGSLHNLFIAKNYSLKL